MAKRIVICSDGTGNTTIKGRGTNVFKLFEAVDVNGHRWDPALTPQVAFYDDGVGTENFKPLQILGGAAGVGLARNVRQLYKELARVYDPGDEIYMFGFSRGAFTVRTLVGFITSCGLVDPGKADTAADFDKLVEKAYKAYRACYRTELMKLLLGGADREMGKRFREANSRRDYGHGRTDSPSIRFLGVWDTVDAVGLPFHVSDIINTTIRRFKFPDRFLSSAVEQACHALAIDEERHSFQPELWNEKESRERIEQVWFAGVHSNVGGGYPKQGMSLVTLDWMMRKAEQAGLRFNCRERDIYRECASVDDKLYDSRAGLGTFYRWKPRNIGALCKAHNIEPVRLHVSAMERVAHGTEDYAPANLPPGTEIVFTPPAHGKDTVLIEQRTENLQSEYNAAVQGQALLDTLVAAVYVGRASYYLFLLSCLALTSAVVVYTPHDAGWWGLAKGGAALIVHPTTLLSILVGFLASSQMSRRVDGAISGIASDFWHRRQRQLREALKHARKSVARQISATPLCWTSTSSKE